MPWELCSDRPIYAQLIELIELKICAGIYPTGAKVPPVRDLAREAAVNPNTMQRALAKLEDDGLLFSRRTAGRFVTEDETRVMEVKNRLVRDHTRDFLDKMRRLGFEEEEILAAVSAIMEEKKK